MDKVKFDYILDKLRINDLYNSNISFNSNVIQTLSGGDNTVNHGKGTANSWTVINAAVWDGNDLVPVDITIIDTDNINVILSGGSITDARIEIVFK